MSIGKEKKTLIKFPTLHKIKVINMEIMKTFMKLLIKHKMMTVSETVRTRAWYKIWSPVSLKLMYWRPQWFQRSRIRRREGSPARSRTPFTYYIKYWNRYTLILVSHRRQWASFRSWLCNSRHSYKVQASLDSRGMNDHVYCWGNRHFE